MGAHQGEQESFDGGPRRLLEVEATELDVQSGDQLLYRRRARSELLLLALVVAQRLGGAQPAQVGLNATAAANVVRHGNTYRSSMASNPRAEARQV